MSDERFKVILGHLHKGYITEEEKGIIRNGLKELQHQLEQKDIKIRNLIRICKKLYNGEELGTGVMNSLYSYGILDKGE